MFFLKISTFGAKLRIIMESTKLFNEKMSIGCRHQVALHSGLHCNATLSKRERHTLEEKTDFYLLCNFRKYRAQL